MRIQLRLGDTEIDLPEFFWVSGSTDDIRYLAGALADKAADPLAAGGDGGAVFCVGFDNEAYRKYQAERNRVYEDRLLEAADAIRAARAEGG